VAEHQEPRWLRWYILATSALLIVLGLAALVFALFADSIGESIIRGAVAFILIFYGIRRVRLSGTN
jgi:membrane-bound ClpP family serine protease